MNESACNLMEQSQVDSYGPVKQVQKGKQSPMERIGGPGWFQKDVIVKYLPMPAHQWNGRK